MAKKDPFFVRFWRWLTKFPVFMTILIITPILIFSTIYLFSTEFVYQNLYFVGNDFEVDMDKFDIKEIKKEFKIMDISSFSNYQGGTCYKEYYVLCSNNFECILIYNMETRKVAHAIYTGQTNTDYHCNTCFFGPAFYSSVDKFPILYVSMENAGVETTIGYRIHSEGGNLTISEVQQLHLVCDKGDKIYLPNSYYDYETDILWYSGYTKNSYMKSDDNFLRYYAFYLPDHRLAEFDLNYSEALKTFDLPSETATQGGFISNHHLYQTFSFNSDSDPLKAPKMRVVDLENQKIVYDNQNLGTLGVYDEFENIAICSNGHIYGFGIRSLSIFDFVYAGGPDQD